MTGLISRLRHVEIVLANLDLLDLPPEDQTVEQIGQRWSLAGEAQEIRSELNRASPGWDLVSIAGPLAELHDALIWAKKKGHVWRT